MSQETERYQLENNGNTYLVRTPAGGGGGADVEANPEGTATEDLEKLKVGETIYGIPPVVGANPVLAGTEPALTGLQIGDTKYAVTKDAVIIDCTSGSLPTGITYNDVVTLMATKVVIAKWLQNTKIYEGIVFQAPQGYVGLRASAFIENFRGIGMYNTLTIYENGTIQILNSENFSYMSPKYNFQNVNAGNSNITSFMNNDTSYNFGAMSTYARTTAPSADNTDGGIRIVVLSSEPATRYNGYLYIITA